MGFGDIASLKDKFITLEVQSTLVTICLTTRMRNRIETVVVPISLSHKKFSVTCERKMFSSRFQKFSGYIKIYIMEQFFTILPEGKTVTCLEDLGTFSLKQQEDRFGSLGLCHLLPRGRKYFFVIQRH